MSHLYKFSAMYTLATHNIAVSLLTTYILKALPFVNNMCRFSSISDGCSRVHQGTTEKDVTQFCKRLDE